MKRTYEKPNMCWQPIRSNRAVAAVCWGHANNHKPFYYNTYGTGYAELYAVGSSCDQDVTFEIRYLPESMSAEERAMADADMQRVIAETIAKLGNGKANPFKNSPFSSDVDPSWS